MADGHKSQLVTEKLSRGITTFFDRRACVAMHNGRMFLCASDVVPASTEGCEGTFLITELGSATCIHSVTR